MLKDVSDCKPEVNFKNNYVRNTSLEMASDLFHQVKENINKQQYNQSYIQYIKSILFERSADVNFCKEVVKKPIQISGKEFNILVGIVNNLKKWIVFALKRIFSGGKPDQSLLKISLDELNDYEDWFRRIKNLTACIKSKNYAGALEILSKCLEYSENLTVIGSNNEKKSAKFLSDLLIFCTGGLQVISSFSVNKNLSRKKLKLSTPNFYCRSATNLVKASKHKTFCCKR